MASGQKSSRGRVSRSEKRTGATKILSYYIRTLWEAAGWKWDGDMDAEMEAIVDLIVDAATEEGADE